MEIGLFTFAELYPDPYTGRTISPEQRMRHLMAEVELADQLGLDVFGIGEHHRADLIVSAPAVVMAAAAARTERIRLTSAVTVLSSDDPVRAIQDFATSICSRVGAPRSWPGVARSPSPSRCSDPTSRTTTSSLRRS